MLKGIGTISVDRSIDEFVSYFASLFEQL